MAHVDALSRVVNHIESFPLEKELEFKQLQDPYLKSIATQLESQDLDDFELIEGLVFRKSSDKSRFIVPSSMINNIIRVYHDELAHCGIEKTVEGIKSNYWFPSMKKKVSEYINNCITCLLANSSVNSREGEMEITESPQVPFDTIHIDHFGPLCNSSDGSKHILVVVMHSPDLSGFLQQKLLDLKKQLNV